MSENHSKPRKLNARALAELDDLRYEMREVGATNKATALDLLLEWYREYENGNG